MGEPGHVPDIDVGCGFDTDGDGRPDTVLEPDGVDLVVAVDLDGDRFADQVLRIGPDAVVRLVGPEPPDAGPVDAPVDGFGDQ
ncbi:hypothetical protein [Pseudonocardia kunmingensis]|uniref:Uncharacterized protein n=1 Tax=Pseudonocardia kunmingensis TaxID=630975 RepID=A0A543E3D3_9PSEU|nr:hypothetical protein [Pseudonocardia kunmingensis]TQM16082.1 hypothetical protein FB558_2885 [Pseudonocardia kunmingensis]